ncbi:hypothetical protein [Terribacillus saccharophilus]|uniref:hypothetical protein n=1 Tax=Terribacillus saccharophilus TaxID=361277 RepID=UPI0039825FCD
MRRIATYRSWLQYFSVGVLRLHSSRSTLSFIAVAYRLDNIAYSRCTAQLIGLTCSYIEILY